MKFAWRVSKQVEVQRDYLCERWRDARRRRRTNEPRGLRQTSAVMKRNHRWTGSVVASDAFFPFPDGVEEAAKAGAKAFIQPAAPYATTTWSQPATALALQWSLPHSPFVTLIGMGMSH